MEYFEGLQIFMGHHTPQCRAWVDKTFVDYWVLDYCHSGRLAYAMGDPNAPCQVIEGPMAWTTFPGTHFRFGNAPTGPPMEWDHRFIAFRGPRVQAMTGSGLLPADRSSRPLPIEAAASFRLAFDELLQAFDDGSSQARMVHLLEGLLLQLHEQNQAKALLSPTGQKVRHLMQRVQNQPQPDWDFEEEASRLGLSYHHLRRVWRQISGEAPRAFVLKCRLDNAARLLRHPTLAVKEIAWQSGFSDFSYFNRLFRRRFGLSPGRFRDQLPL